MNITLKDNQAMALLFAATVAGGANAAPAGQNPAPVPGAVAPVAELFPLSSVRLLDSPFTRAAAANREYMLALDPDRLLAPFRREAELESRKPSYENWENIGLDGHTAGHYLSALAYMIASGNDTKDGELRRRLDYMLSEMSLSKKPMVMATSVVCPAVVSSGRPLLPGEVGEVWKKWVPWYNIHKTFAGLRDAYLIAGDTRARDMLIRMGDWAVKVTGGLSDEQMQQMLDCEYGGMNEVMADIYAITGDAKYLEAARRFNHKAVLDPLQQKRTASPTYMLIRRFPRSLDLSALPRSPATKKRTPARASSGKL
jgi:DUF1680 family protein